MQDADISHDASGWARLSLLYGHEHKSFDYSGLFQGIHTQSSPRNSTDDLPVKPNSNSSVFSLLPDNFGSLWEQAMPPATANDAPISLTGHHTAHPHFNDHEEPQNVAESNSDTATGHHAAQPPVAANSAQQPRDGADTRNPNARIPQRISVSKPLPNGWQHLQQVDLAQEFRVPVSPLEDVPWAIRDDYKRIQAAVFRNLVHCYDSHSDTQAPERINAWKLFSLLSRMLLHRLRRWMSRR